MDSLSRELTWFAVKGFFSEVPHRHPAWIGCREGRIAAIENTPPTSCLQLPAQWAVPLLADTHAHVYMSAWPIEPGSRLPPGGGSCEAETCNALARIKRAYELGIGFIRDMGDPLGINFAVRDRLARTGSDVPELQVPGPALFRSGNYGRYLGLAGDSFGNVLELLETSVVRRNADYAKIVATGIVNFEKARVMQAPQFSVGEIKIIVARAHEHGLKTAAHCSGDDGLDQVLSTGIEFIEHGYFMRADQVHRLEESRQYWTPTLAPVAAQRDHPECGWNDATRTVIERIVRDHQHAVWTAHSVGVRLLAGTDAGSPGVELGPGLHHELQLMEEAGVPAAALLGIATARAADACNPRHYTGRLRIGDPADFALYRKPPWEQMSNLLSLASIVSGGMRAAGSYPALAD